MGPAKVFVQELCKGSIRYSTLSDLFELFSKPFWKIVQKLIDKHCIFEAKQSVRYHFGNLSRYFETMFRLLNCSPIKFEANVLTTSNSISDFTIFSVSLNAR